MGINSASVQQATHSLVLCNELIRIHHQATLLGTPAQQFVRINISLTKDVAKTDLVNVDQNVNGPS